MKKILNTIKRKRKDAALFAGATAVYALIVPGILFAANSFPGSLNSWSPGDVIPSSWANALEDKIGADNSSVQTSLDWLVSTSSAKTATSTLQAGGGANDTVFQANAETGNVRIGTTTVDALTTLFVAPTSTDATSVAKFTNSAGTSVFNITPSSGVEIDDKWVLDAQTQNNIEALRFTGTGVNDIAEAILEAKGSGGEARLSVTADSGAQTGISLQDDGTDAIIESFKRGGGTLHELKFSIDGTATTTIDTAGDWTFENGIIATNATSTNLKVSGDFTCTNCIGTTEITDSFLLNTGDIGTGVYDFGGATSFEIPNGTGNTVNADGEITHDTTDDQLVFGADADVVSSETSKGFSVASTTLGAATTTINAPPFQNGITVIEISCYSKAGTSTLQVADGAGNEMLANGLVCSNQDNSNVTQAAQTATISNASLTALEFWEIRIGNVSATEPDWVVGNINHTTDRQ